MFVLNFKSIKEKTRIPKLYKNHFTLGNADKFYVVRKVIDKTEPQFPEKIN